MSDDEDDYEDAAVAIPNFEKPDLDDLEDFDLKAASLTASKAVDARNKTETDFDDENLGWFCCCFFQVLCFLS